MINENVMAQGSFEVPLKTTVPYSLWDEIELFGHIVVFPQWLDPNQVGTDPALDAARYAGPVLEKDTSGDGLVLRGAGMTWWLGDDLGNGPFIETKKTFSAQTFSNTIAALVPSAVELGTLVNTGLGTFTGDFHWETPLEAIRAVCLAVGAEFRINPDGSIDAGRKDFVFNINTPTVVVVRRGFGHDAAYVGVPVERMRTWLNAREYVTKVTAITENSNGTKTLIDSSTRADTHFDLHGNAFTRSRVVSLGISNPIEMVTYTLGVLNGSAIEQNQEISTEHYELVGGDFAVGDNFYAYDPPAFLNTANQITFRGDVINPAAVRLIAASWPLRNGMGVWYKSSASASNIWVDLTKFVAWEGESGEFL